MDVMKMRKPKLYLLALCLCCPLLGASEYEHEKQAERLFSEGFYEDAAIYFEQAAVMGMDVSTYLKLAVSYLEMENPKKALDFLRQDSNFKGVENERLYLMSRAHRRLGQYQAVITLLPPSASTTLLSLEKGIALYHLNHYPEAEKELGKIDSHDLPSYSLSKLYLLRIALKLNQTDKAKNYLKSLNTLLTDNTKSYERNFLEGLQNYLSEDYLKASQLFEKISPPSSQVDWTATILTYLVDSLLKTIQNDDSDSYFTKAEESIQKLITLENSDQSYLFLAELYFLEAQKSHKEEPYRKGLKVINSIQSPEVKKKAFFKQAVAAPTYEERALLFDQLANENDPIILFYSGLNDYQKAILNDDSMLFKKAALSFDKALALFKPQDDNIIISLQFQILARVQRGNPHEIHDARNLIYQFLSLHPEAPAKLYHLLGHISLISEDFEAEEKLRQGISLYPDDHGIKIVLGKYYTKRKEWDKADDILSLMPDNPEALFWRAVNLQNKGENELAKPYLERIYNEHPSSPFAPAAYFHYYSYREYIRGQRKAIKHLQGMPILFNDHPLSISALFLMGLDNKKKHFSEDGKLIRQKDLIFAIEAFHQTEATFDKLLSKNRIPEKDKEYFTQVRYRAILERAAANYEVALESEWGKKLIYLQYSEDLYRSLIAEFQKSTPLLSIYIIAHADYPKILEEAEYGLARTYLAKNKSIEAENTLNGMLDKYRKANIKQSYLLSRAWYNKGLIAQKNGNLDLALAAYFAAELGGMGFLSPDEKLDLWIQQSLCFKDLQKPNEAMKLLSKVANDETISNLRIKAMYLRAELYAMQGRKELALKQLIATSKKGGEWGKKAKEKLEREYE